MEPIPKYRDNIGDNQFDESWLSGITNRWKTGKYIGYPRCIIYGIFCVVFAISACYNIGNQQYSSKNLSYCPMNRFLESVPLLTPHGMAVTGTDCTHRPGMQGIEAWSRLVYVLHAWTSNSCANTSVYVCSRIVQRSLLRPTASNRACKARPHNIL